MTTWRDVAARHPALSAIGNTPLVRVDAAEATHPGVEIHAKLESFNPGGSIKDRPVLRMLCAAVADGRLAAGRTVLDSSSGNAGIAYAMIGSVLGFPVELVVPGNASEERKKRILAHGARLVFTDPVLGYDEAMREVHRRAEREPAKYFFCDQYANGDNWRAHYETTAEEILRQLPAPPTHAVLGVGTGGTITGVGRRLREAVPGIEIACVIPDSFPGIEGLKPLENPEDIVPKILDQSVIDRRIKVTIDEAYEECSRLARHGFFVGQSSGAFYRGALEVARSAPKGSRIVTVFPDLGERYFSTRLWDG